MARPRRVADKDILEAAYDIIMQEGPGGLTFEALSSQTGLVPAALVKRFKNKKQLIAAIDRYGLERTNVALKEAMERHDSPIEAIIAGLVAEMAFARTLKGYVSGQSFLLMDLSDPELYDNYHVSFHERQKQSEELLEKAKRRGLLRSDVDSKQLAILFQIIQQGSGHVWAMSQDKEISDYIKKYVRIVLDPYLVDKKADQKGKL
jgi:AcrR family transcriptional regulator